MKMVKTLFSALCRIASKAKSLRAGPLDNVPPFNNYYSIDIAMLLSSLYIFEKYAAIKMPSHY
jgi:hypothetical protein